MASKKRTRRVIFLLILLLIGFVIYKFFFEKSRFKSINLIPPDAVLIMQIDDPYKTWDEINKTNIWSHLRNLRGLKKFTGSVSDLHEALKEKDVLLKAFGSGKTTLSLHVADEQLIWLLTLDSKFAGSLSKYLSNIKLEHFNVTKRSFNEQTILEVYDVSNEKYYFLSSLKGKIIASTNNEMIEKAIRESEFSTIGRDQYFLNVEKNVRGKGIMRLYINYEQADDLLKDVIEDGSKFSKTIKPLKYSGLTVDLINDDLKIDGYTSIDTTQHSMLTFLLQSGSKKMESSSIIPEENAFLYFLGFHDLQTYYNKIHAQLDEKTQKKIRSAERLVDMTIDDTFLSWIGNEITMVQLKPSGLGYDNELVIMVRLNNANEAVNKLEKINRYLKWNSPAQFNEFEYKDFTINYLAVGSMFQFLTGNFVDRITKPFYTIVNNYLIISNHPQVLKNVIDDYREDNVLENNEDFKKFRNEFASEHSIFLLIQPPVLFRDLQKWLEPDIYALLKKNYEYLTCFPLIGIEGVEKESMYETRLRIRYSDPEPYYTPGILKTGESIAKGELFDASRDSITLWVKEINETVIPVLDAGEYNFYYEDGSLKHSFSVNQGLKDGRFKSYYKNGETKIKGRFKDDKPTGTWRFYDISGDLIEKRNAGEL